MAPPGVTCVANTVDLGAIAESPPSGSPPPAAYTAIFSPDACGSVATASATPAGAPGKAGRDCHVSAAGAKATRGRTWIVAVRRRPAALVTVSSPLAALSGTIARSSRSLHPPGGTGAATAPPPILGKLIAPPPCESPKPKPSMTIVCPPTRSGSIAPSTKSTRGVDAAGPMAEPPHASTAASASGTRLARTLGATNEPDCLDESLGHRRQLGRSLRQIFDGPQLLGRRRGHRLGLVCGRRSSGGGLGQCL